MRIPCTTCQGHLVFAWKRDGSPLLNDLLAQPGDT